MVSLRLPPPLRRRPVPVLLGVAVVLALLGVVLWAPATRGQERLSGSLTLSTGAPSGVYARYGTLLQSQLAREAPDLDITLRGSAGSVENIERLVSGEADFAIATADSLASYQAAGGEGADTLLACARLYDDYIQLVVRADSPVESAADLAGLRVGVGQDQSGVQLVTRELLAAAGLDMDRDITAVRQGINTTPTMLEAGRIDAFFWSGGLPTSAVERLARHSDVRLVPLGDLVPALRGEDGSYRDHYRAAVLPPDAYPDIAGSQVIDTVAVANLLVTTDRVDPALAEQMTRSVINGRDRIGSQVHAAQRVDLRTAIYTQPLPLHPGAREYYRSAKS
ncbi:MULTISPECIES: TAXI family TRAP transporter solute-binding subunit [Streptomyces]|jgi:TRAP transporter TAXI family solute receptor|uniref:TAXI family TRAP transporter solute-binding subunit n=1 Tax=Streptomyces TaxID=1883 RepID=UPI001904C7CF|nr:MULTISPECIES: TAXI family TRAP transporter solute-binding subunit [unclassified Streptomyces]MCU4746612.1 TAXI family TRAP transporter solute-binding subunit [Streptomyces sp. G-5]QQN76868.1 TAXI family TRAP transporter solute-binding subunit [Streptomyces sp. XC 2026]